MSATTRTSGIIQAMLDRPMRLEWVRRREGDIRSDIHRSDAQIDRLSES